jgi:hypothetical protein
MALYFRTVLGFFEEGKISSGHRCRIEANYRPESTFGCEPSRANGHDLDNGTTKIIRGYEKPLRE